MNYYEETCSCCSTQLVPGDPRTRDAYGVYCTRLACIAEKQWPAFESAALQLALLVAMRIRCERAEKAVAA